MDIAIAVVHIVGAVTTVLILSLVLGLLVIWQNERVLEETDAVAGASDEAGAVTRGVQFSSEQSSRVFNRLRLIRKAWSWAGLLAMIVVIGEVIWHAIVDTLSRAAYAWWIVAIFIFFEATGLLISAACRLLTGHWLRKHAPPTTADGQPLKAHRAA